MNAGHKTIVAMLAVVAVLLAVNIVQGPRTTVASGPPTQPNGPPTPIIEYLFEEGAGGFAINTGSLGESADGLIGGAMYSDDTPCDSLFSLEFDGDDDHIEVPNVYEYEEAVTVEAWIRPNVVSDQSVIWDNYGNPGVLLAVRDGQLQFVVSTEEHPTGIPAVGGTIVVGEWQHVAGIYDPRLEQPVVALINGRPVDTRVTFGRIIRIDRHGTVGADDAGLHDELNFDGRIDDFRVYDVAVSGLGLGYYDCPVGACCTNEGECIEVRALDCLRDHGGTYQGDGTLCQDVVCSGACCVNDVCVDVPSESACRTIGGTFFQGITCDGFDCPGPCRSDINDDNVVDFLDLLTLLSDWGPCDG